MVLNGGYAGRWRGGGWLVIDFTACSVINKNGSEFRMYIQYKAVQEPVGKRRVKSLKNEKMVTMTSQF